MGQRTGLNSVGICVSHQKLVVAGGILGNMGPGYISLSYSSCSFLMHLQSSAKRLNICHSFIFEVPKLNTTQTHHGWHPFTTAKSGPHSTFARTPGTVRIRMNPKTHSLSQNCCLLFISTGLTLWFSITTLESSIVTKKLQ